MIRVQIGEYEVTATELGMLFITSPKVDRECIGVITDPPVSLAARITLRSQGELGAPEQFVAALGGVLAAAGELGLLPKPIHPEIEKLMRASR